MILSVNLAILAILSAQGVHLAQAAAPRANTAWSMCCNEYCTECDPYGFLCGTEKNKTCSGWLDVRAPPLSASLRSAPISSFLFRFHLEPCGLFTCLPHLPLSELLSALLG